MVLQQRGIQTVETAEPFKQALVIIIIRVFIGLIIRMQDTI